MVNTDWILVGLLFLGAVVLLGAALKGLRHDEKVEKRLEEALGEIKVTDAKKPEGQREVSGTVATLALWGEKLAGNEKSRLATAKLLAQAGFSTPSSLGLFLLLKTVLGLVLGLTFLFSGNGLTLGSVAMGLIGYFVGGIAPEWILKSLAARRYTALERSMPDALDLMVICAEAGLPFSRIVRVVAQELQLSAPVLAKELLITNAELEISPERTTALKNLAFRTQVPSIESMVATLIQAEQFGTPLAQALRNIATETRKTLILTLEERAGKLPARLSIPLMTLILPPVIAIVATPALMRVIRSLML